MASFIVWTVLHYRQNRETLLSKCIQIPAGNSNGMHPAVIVCDFVHELYYYPCHEQILCLKGQLHLSKLLVRVLYHLCGGVMSPFCEQALLHRQFPLVKDTARIVALKVWRWVYVD